MAMIAALRVSTRTQRVQADTPFLCSFSAKPFPFNATEVGPRVAILSRVRSSGCTNRREGDERDGTGEPGGGDGNERTCGNANDDGDGTAECNDDCNRRERAEA